MHSRYYSTSAAIRAGQLASWDKYRELELQLKQNAVTEAGDLLEYETLELRIHPPNVRIDNESHEDKTVLIIDSANRPGTLVEVVQCLTELGLSVSQARISSDGGWFVDEFHVSETPAGRVTDPKKLDAIKSVLSLPEHSGEPAELHTVFQIAGPETPGILAEITQLLSHNGLEIRTAAAWTYNKRAAIVLGVTEHNAAVCDRVKLHRLKQLLVKLVEKKGDAAVSVEQVEGPVHHERRLHQLLLADEIQAWKQLTRLQRQHSLPFPGPINTNLPAGAADTDVEADQMPQTPQQQWQRRMLPPTWTVDPRGKPMLRDDPVQPQPQQQQQQQVALQPQKQHHSQDALDDAAAAGTVADVAAAVKRDVSGAGSRRSTVQSISLPPLPPEAISAAAVVARDGGVAARDQAAVAAAAAQQASVDKLIALLQPQPLAHAISLPKAATAAGGPQQQQQGITTAGRGAAAAPAGPSPQDHAVTAGPVPLNSVSSSNQTSAANHHEPAVVSADLQGGGSSSSRGGSTEPNQQQQSHPGLPPRAPGPIATAGHSSTSSTITTTTTPQLPHPVLLGSASAPTSPLAPKAVDTTTATAGVTAADHVAASALLSPGRFASASAAAGQISPRAFTRAGSTPVPGTAGSMFGMQQHLLQSAQQPPDSHASIYEHGSSPDVNIQHSSLFNYWLVTIRCRDRNKLFFDTVCTLCDMRYDIYHATIDGEASGWANQLFYIRPRFGVCDFDERRASVLKAMLVSAVQRRFPAGLRVHVFTGSTVCLQDLFNSMRRLGLTITRCKVRAYDNASHTFYLLNQDGSLPSKQYVRQACQAAGGELVEAPLDVANPCVATVLRSLDARGRFAFSFVNKRQLNRLAATAPEVAGAVPFSHSRTAAAQGLSERGVTSAYDDHGAHGGGTGKRGVAALALMRSLGGRDQHREGMSATGSTSSFTGSDHQPSF